MFFLVPAGLSSLAAKCTVVGAACVTVVAAEAIRSHSLLESFKTKAGSAFAFPFAFKRPAAAAAAAAEPSQPLSSSSTEAHTVQVAAEVDGNDFPDVTDPMAGDHLPVFDETIAPVNANKIVEAAFATEDFKCDCDGDSCINVPEDHQVDLPSSTLRSAAINIKMQALGKLSFKTVIEGDPPPAAAAADDDGDGGVRKLVNVIDSVSLDTGQQAACGKLPLMSDLVDEAVAVKAKAIDMAADGDHHLDPTAGKNDDTLIDVLKTQSISATGNCSGGDNAYGRSWVTRIYEGIRDVVRGSINHIRSWLGKIYGAIHGCTETADIAVCKQNLPQNNAVFSQNLPALAMALKKWIWDHRVILKMILLVVGECVMETPSFCALHQSRKRLVMKLYQLLRSELR